MLIKRSRMSPTFYRGIGLSTIDAPTQNIAIAGVSFVIDFEKSRIHIRD